jgi:hypothetical protein
LLLQQWGLVGGAIAAGATTLMDEAGLLIVTFHRFRVRARDLLLGNWRCVLATAVMASSVLAMQYERGTLAGSHRAGIHDMALDVALGMVSYAGTLLLAWVAAGRPRGAEAYAIEVAQQARRTMFVRRGWAR